MTLLPGCIIPPDIEVEPNYPPKVDISLVQPRPFGDDDQNWLQLNINEQCDTPNMTFFLPWRAITDQNKGDQHFVRFFYSTQHGWSLAGAIADVREDINGYVVEIVPARIPTPQRLVLYALVTDRPWPAEAENDRQLAKGAKRTELFWIIEVIDDPSC
ncbi:MAG: hypothetical protein GXP49_05300 [Deltaproteobacteria bacterium]|nr:hypothetical protein [Deltaproteobacteria bacterium]